MSSIYGFFGSSHSASTSLVEDGEIKFCIEEERLDRVKSGIKHETYPILSSKKVEELSRINIRNADYRIFVEPVPHTYAKKLTNFNYETVSHHLSHCYGAYFTSGFQEKCLTISYDGGGFTSTMRVYLCEEGKMNLLKKELMATYGSLGHLWAFVVNGIRGYDEEGYGVWRMCKDEGKLMGMAPDGEYNPQMYKMLKSCIDYEKGTLKFFPSDTAGRTRFLVDTLHKKGYFNEQKNVVDFSYNLQKLTEDLFLEFINDLHERFPDYKKICLSGGLFANVKLNQKINELDWVDEIYVYPAMGDEGLTLGACIYKSVELGEWVKPKRLSNVFFGTSYTDEEIDKISKEFDFEKTEYSPEVISNLIREGKIIGWFQNKMEYGPRALGSRSILVKPTDVSTHKLLNKRLKRYDTMPFAPVVMDEYFDEIFTCSKSKYSAEFMTICYSTKTEWIEKIPAVIQKSDKTARPQIVTKNNNPKLWNLMNEYYKLEKIPVLLNTSFNSHNQPIIENPKQAFESLNNKIIDVLVIENYVFRSK